MNRRKNTYIIIIIVAALVIIKMFSFLRHDTESTQSFDVKSFRNSNHPILTKHAKCRMECRHITLEEIKGILHDGNENYTESGEGSKGDKTYALEGYSTERQHIRIVVAPENNEVVVITCIDLDKDWPCNCN